MRAVRALLVVVAMTAGACATAERPIVPSAPDPTALPDSDVAASGEADQLAAPAPPELSAPADQLSAEGETVELQLTAADPNGDPLTFSAAGLPPGLTVDSAAARVSGVVAAGARGSYTVTVSADDGFEPVAATFGWVVTPATVATEATDVRFAVIGNWGTGDATAALVSGLVTSWDVDLVATTGNNNFPDGAADTIDANIGQYYSDFIGSYGGAFGVGASENRFFPALGELDWRSLVCEITGCAGPHFDYFELPGNERYYDVREGSVHLFVLDSDVDEPDGRGQDSVQARWLRAGLEASDAIWKVVLVHHPGWSSATGSGSEVALRWPFAAWGADAVLAGHNRVYERLTVDGIPHLVNGAGGAEVDEFGPPLEVSVFRDNASLGATRVLATESSITFQFVDTDGSVIDSFTRAAEGRNAPPAVDDPGPQFSAAGEVAALVVGATDIDGDTVTVSAENLPPGLGLDGPSGIVFGTVTAPPGSRFEVVVVASDGVASSTATFDWFIGPSDGTTVSSRPLSGSDDAEETPSGEVSTVSTDLELIRDEDTDGGAVDQTVGIRFPGLALPQGATILDARIEFVTDELGSDPTSLTMRAEATDDALTFTQTARNVSGRPLTDAAVAWSNEPWDNVGGIHRTPDLSSLVDEITSRPGWQPGNAMVFVITGSGRRTASSVDLDTGRGPRLVVTYAS